MNTQPNPDRLAQLDTLILDEGSHEDFDDGHCAMEVVAWLAGEGFTDAPACASVVLRKYTIGLNDTWDATTRQGLKPYLVRMIGTGGDGQDEARSYMALDWMIRTYTPAWLDLAGLTAEATALRDLRRIVDMVSAEAAGPVVRAGRDKAAAARDAAGDAAWDAAGAAALAAARAAARAAAWDAARAAGWAAAWDAAGDAAWDAAWAAAGDAAGAAAGAAAWDAARAAGWAAAWDAAGDAAWDAAWAAAGDAAGAAAWAAAWAAAGAAAGDAAGDALRPTVTTLQASALELLDQMIDPKAVTR